CRKRSRRTLIRRLERSASRDPTDVTLRAWSGRKGRSGGKVGGKIPSCPSCPSRLLYPSCPLEVDRRVEPNEARHQNRVWPRPARGIRRVVHETGIGIEHVVDVDTDQRARPPVLQDLGDADVDLVDPIAIQLAGQKEVQRRVAGSETACRQQPQ